MSKAQGYHLDLQVLKDMFENSPIILDEMPFYISPKKSSTLEEALVNGDLHFLNKYSALLSLHNLLLELLALKTPMVDAIVYVSVKIDGLAREMGIN